MKTLGNYSLALTGAPNRHLHCVRLVFALWLVAVAPASLLAQRPVLAGRANAAKHSGPREDLTSSATPAWTFEFDATVDTGLANPSAVYDSATNGMIVFGGADANLGYADTNAVLLRATANGSGNWSTLIANGAPGAPVARDSHTAVYDSTNNLMIVFGGEAQTGTILLNDVWVLSNANGQGGTPTWTELAPSGTPPAARFGHTAVYDAASNRMVVFGGFGSTMGFSDVWVLSNASGLGGTPAWTKLSPSGGPPLGVFFSTAVYDPTNNIMTVFGGTNSANTVYTNAVWTLSHADGLGGTPQWTNIVANGAVGSPAKRAEGSAIYDVTNNRMTIFGGANLSGFPNNPLGLNDVWVLANANGLGGTPTWKRLRPPGVAPGIRFGHTAVYDAVNNLMIVFAGDNDDAQYYATWVLSGANGL